MSDDLTNRLAAAHLLIIRNEFAEARAALESLVSDCPGSAEARKMLDSVETRMAVDACHEYEKQAADDGPEDSASQKIANLLIACAFLVAGSIVACVSISSYRENGKGWYMFVSLTRYSNRLVPLPLASPLAFAALLIGFGAWCLYRMFREWRRST